MPKIDRSKIPFDNNRVLSEGIRAVIAGREKQKLGDAVGLTQFGVNISRIKAHSKSALRHWHESEDEFIYMLEGELVLHENDGETVLKPGDAAGWRANGGIGHCLINRTDRDARLSRGRHPLEGRARALSRRRFRHGARRQGPPLDAQVRRADQGIEAALPRERSDGRQFQARRRCRRHRARHLGHARPLDERHRSRGDRGIVEDRREGRGRRRDQGRGHHLGQGDVLRRRRSHAARHRSPARSPTWPRARARRPRRRCCSSREPQAVAALPAHRDLRQAVRRRDQRHRARRRLRALPRLPPAHRRRQRQDPPRPARDQDRPVPRRRRHPAHRAHDGARPTRCNSCSRATSSGSTAPRR